MSKKTTQAYAKSYLYLSICYLGLYNLKRIEIFQLLFFLSIDYQNLQQSLCPTHQEGSMLFLRLQYPIS